LIGRWTRLVPTYTKMALPFPSEVEEHKQEIELTKRVVEKLKSYARNKGWNDIL